MPASGATNSSYGTARKLAAAKAKEYTLVDSYKFGYRNREDITNLPPGVLIVGSQNVLHNVSDRIQIRQGYTVDGQTSSVVAGIESSYDWFTQGNGERHLRAGFNDTGSDGILQYRYVDSNGNVTWNNLLVGLSSVDFNFTTWWNATELLRECLFVNGQSQIQSWNGAIATFANATNSSGFILTLNATPTNGGTGYVIGDILTIAGGTATAKVTSVTGATAGSITSVSVEYVNTGSGWQVGDVLSITQAGGSNGTVTVTSVDNAGTIISVSILTAGTGYTQNFATIAGGHGTGYMNIYISSIGGQAISAVELVTTGSGYSTGTGKTTTGGTGTGATLKIDAIAQGSITIQGTEPILQLGFYSQTPSKQNLLINNIPYSYSGIYGQTFVGISPDPTQGNISVGQIITQQVVTTLNSAMTTISSTFLNGLIATLNNQVFVGSLTSSVYYISKVNSYTDYSFSSPRLPGEGWNAPLDDNLVAFIPQENFMYISCGQSMWYNVSFSDSTATSTGITTETVGALRLKTGSQQGAYSQAFISQMKNNVIMLTNEPTIDMMGRLEQYFGTPQQANLSDSIKLDMDSYDFTGGSIFYFQYYIYVAIPSIGVVRIYNLQTKAWEAPQTIPISRFYIVGNKLYGHSSITSESYQLFTGYADRVYGTFQGYPISAIARFSYENYGTRATKKKANAFYVEGYINANTILNITLTYELDGCATTKNLTVNGSDKQVVCIRPIEGSLGKVSLGKEKLGGAGSQSLTGLPPKFRAIPTFTNTDFFEVSPSFSVLGINNRVEILAFGLNASGSSQEATNIKQ